MTGMSRLSYCAEPQPLGLKTRSIEAGNFTSLLAGRRGRATSSPPQLGHRPESTPLAHDSQYVHSNEQIRASVDSGARSRLQHSQFGLSCSIAHLVRYLTCHAAAAVSSFHQLVVDKLVRICRYGHRTIVRSVEADDYEEHHSQEARQSCHQNGVKTPIFDRKH